MLNQYYHLNLIENHQKNQLVGRNIKKKYYHMRDQESFLMMDLMPQKLLIDKIKGRCFQLLLFLVMIPSWR